MSHPVGSSVSTICQIILLTPFSPQSDSVIPEGLLFLSLVLFADHSNELGEHTKSHGTNQCNAMD